MKIDDLLEYVYGMSLAIGVVLFVICIVFKNADVISYFMGCNGVLQCY